MKKTLKKHNKKQTDICLRRCSEDQPQRDYRQSVQHAGLQGVCLFSCLFSKTRKESVSLSPCLCLTFFCFAVPLYWCVCVAVCQCLSVSVCIRHACILLLFSYFNCVPLYLAVSVFCGATGHWPKKQVAILKEIKEVASGAFHAAVLRYVLIYFLRCVIYFQLPGPSMCPRFQSSALARRQRCESTKYRDLGHKRECETEIMTG